MYSRSIYDTLFPVEFALSSRRWFHWSEMYMRIHMSKQQEMIDQLESKSNARCLEAIDALYGVQSDEILASLLRSMVSDESTFWTNLDKDRHPKVEAYKAALEIATSEALRGLISSGRSAQVALT